MQGFLLKLIRIFKHGNSPIVYGHTLLKHHEMPGDWGFWKNFCEAFLLKADEMLVYKLSLNTLYRIQ